MSGKMRGLLVVGLVVLAVASGSLGLVSAHSARGGSPETVVGRFYEAYLEAHDTLEDRGNPLVDGSYRRMPGLHPDYVARVDALLASFAESETPGGYDPLLQAQDVPEAVYAEAAMIVDERAYVPVTSSFPGHRFLVTLVRQGGRWQILNVTATPEQVVASFYGWYTHQEENPLVTGAYGDRADLTPNFINQVDATLASFAENETPGGYDPVLLAQDVPVEIQARPATFTASGATVTVEMLWGGNPEPTLRQVTLILGEQGWQIDAVTAD